ncbi:hypothetical protein ASG68_29620 [Rhizobium sp. Leaf453]|nr:hypothetical protein ASG50_28805 [Rhizobium sp. Leaf386]KQU00064.1 hypothetical protein ASG68_29620 [Rhizobium sp. Leaf453]
MKQICFLRSYNKNFPGFLGISAPGNRSAAKTSCSDISGAPEVRPFIHQKHKSGKRSIDADVAAQWGGDLHRLLPSCRHYQLPENKKIVYSENLDIVLLFLVGMITSLSTGSG